MSARRAADLAALVDSTLSNGSGSDLDEQTKGLLDQVKEVLLMRAEQPEVPPPPPPPPDNTVRDIMAREAAYAMRTDRERALAKGDMQDDDEFISILHNSKDYMAVRTARLISITARYAGELQHTLIHPEKRRRLKDAKLDGLPDLWKAIKDGGHDWDNVVDPGLAGNARIACQNVADALPALHGLQVHHILKYIGNRDAELLDFFCAAVAARWRSTTVFAAGPYKTGNEQNAVRIALKDALQICRDYCLVDDVIKWQPRPKAPTCIAEMPTAYM